MKRYWRLGLIALPVLLAAHYAYWRISADRLEEGFALWRGQRAQSGWSVENGQGVRGGYPFAATLEVPRVRLTGADPALPGGVTWQAERVVLRVSLARPWLLRIEPDGAQQLRLAANPEVPFHADGLTVVFPLDPTVPGWAELSVPQLRATMPPGDAAGDLTVRGLRAHADLNPAAPRGQPAITVSALVDSVGLPPGLNPPLGPNITQIELRGSLGGPLPRGGGPAVAAGQWRDGGGTVEIGALGLQWGKLTLNTTASLSLDEQLQPAGMAKIRMTGQSEALDALVAAGALPQRTAQMVGTMIALFAPPAKAGSGDGAVEIPLTLHQRRLFTRQVPLGRLPVLRWSER